MKKITTLIIAFLVCLSFAGCKSETVVTITDPDNPAPVVFDYEGDLDYYKGLVADMEKPEEALADKVLKVTGEFTNVSLGIYYIGDMSGDMKCALSFAEKTDEVKALKEGMEITVVGTCISAGEDYIQIMDAKLIAE